MSAPVSSVYDRTLDLSQNVLETEVTDGVTKLESDEAASQAAIAADQAAITALLNSTPAYTSAVNQLQSDTTGDANAVQSDQAILSAAQAKLTADQANAPAGSLYISWGGTLTIPGGNAEGTISMINISSGTPTFIPVSGMTADSGIIYLASGSLEANSGSILTNGSADGTIVQSDPA